jgi:LacI family sucrose operon transcriptional repressor
MAKIEDVAERAGVSVTTVSRVMNNRGYISQKTRDRVQEAMEELNYQPNEMARALFRRKSNMIGLVIPAVSHPFFAELAQHLEYYADQQDYKLLLCNSNRNVDKERKYIEMLKKNQVDGIIMGSSVLDIEHYLNINLPIVSFDRVVSDNIPVVASDSYMGGRLAAELLIERGCRKPVYAFRGLGGPHHQALLASGRAQGFGEKLGERGIEPLYMPLEMAVGETANADAIARFLAERPDIDGIFASSDVIAAEVLQACSRIGRGIPRDIKLIGYDDVSLAQWTSPRLSTVKQPIREMSERTIAIMIQQIEGAEVPMINTFPVALIERETT